MDPKSTTLVLSWIHRIQTKFLDVQRNGCRREQVLHKSSIHNGNLSLKLFYLLLKPKVDWYFIVNLLISSLWWSLYCFLHNPQFLIVPQRIHLPGGCSVLNMYKSTWVRRRGFDLDLAVLRIHTINTFRIEKYSHILTLNIYLKRNTSVYKGI